MQIAILSYENSTVIVRELPENFTPNTPGDDVEEWMEENGYHVSSCNYMTAVHLEINIFR